MSVAAWAKREDAAMAQAGLQDGPLAGLTVVEAGGEIATRYCGRLFAAMGACVAQLPPEPIEPVNGRGEAGRLFLAWLDANKQAAPDLASALALAKDAKPLVIAGQTPAAVQAMDARLAINGADCIRLGLTWFGDVGPYADWRGHDAVIQALGGVAFGFGLPEGPPILPQGHAPQLLGGLVGFSGALGALMGGLDGPRRIDVNVFETAMCFSEIGAITCAYAPEIRSGRNGINRYTPTFPSSIYETADGYIGVTALTPAQWAALCQLMVDPDWAEAFQFFTSLERLGCADEIDAVLIPLFAEKPTAYWVEAGDRLRIPITPVPRPRELPAMAHWSGRAAFEDLGGDVSAPSLPFRFDFDGVASPRPAGGSAGPLSGVRVADFSMGWAGPLGARYLADLGADVLKIECRNKPDWWRGWEVVEDQDPPLHELARNFMAVNRSKRGLDLDLASPEGKAAAEAIIRRSDVVIDNQGPGVMDRLGLGQADQRRLRPGVISIAMPPFGRGGPLSGLRAYGSTVEQASGMPFVNGLADWPPSMQHVAYGDPVAGLYAAAAALAALYGRDRLGGAEIDLCQVECLFQLAADAIVADQAGGVVRTGSRRPGEAPVCVVPAKRDDEAWLAVAVDTDEAWRALCGLIADPALSPAWGLAERRAHEAEIEAAIGRWAADQPPEQAATRLQAAGVPAAPVLPTHELWRNPHLDASGYWAVQHRRYLGEHMTPRPTFRFDGERPALTNPAPTLGEHTAEALAGLGSG
jgi:crotonobetainyl-CoA:carnitine CoA-transferase CaiB-like acyl-CoA transferase